jgi:hypothetical protein
MTRSGTYRAAWRDPVPEPAALDIRDELVHDPRAVIALISPKSSISLSVEGIRPKIRLKLFAVCHGNARPIIQPRG